MEGAQAAPLLFFAARQRERGRGHHGNTARGLVVAYRSTSASSYSARFQGN
jgi:hypothetical protein